MAKFKKGDIVTGIKRMQQYAGYKGFYKVLEVTHHYRDYGGIVIAVDPLTPVEYYERLQYQRHFKLAPKWARILYGR